MHLKILTDNNDDGPNTKKYQDYICGYGYKLKCVYEQYNKPYKTYFSDDGIDKFVIGMVRESEYCSRVIERKFKKPLCMTKRL